jgi:hypothetical protein
VWLEQAKYEQAEGRYHEALARSRAGLSQGAVLRTGSSGVSDSIGATMTMIQQSLSANPQVVSTVFLQDDRRRESEGVVVCFVE